MAETQKSKLARLEKELKKQIDFTKQTQEEADRLYAKLLQLQSSADTEFSRSPNFQQLIHENEILKNRVETLESRLNHAQKKMICR